MSTYYDAFISYARKDSKKLGEKLTQRLQAEGLKVWFDQNDIPPAVDWQAQIDDGIIRSHNFLFIISPRSIKSSYCRIEIELAVKFNKRILPLLHVDSDENYQEMHPIIQQTHWLFWVESSDKFKFESSLNELLETMRKHEDYVQQHTQYLVSALNWQTNQKQTQYLLVGEDRVKSEAWLKARFTDIEQPPCIPTDLHCEYICESTKNANNLLTQVFICSAEKDEASRDKLVKYLQREGITTWINKTDSNSGFGLEQQINQGIEGGDNFIFLVSVDSVENYWTCRELEHAFKHNKRIIPIFLDTIRTELIPVEIQGLEYLNNLEPENLAELTRIIKEEAIYYQRHKLLLVKALKWQSQNRNRSLLLRGYNLQHFEAWFNTAVSRKTHPPLPIQFDFLQASKGQTTDEVLDVFISYSRADADFARKLNNKLQELGKTTWFDQESIAVGEDFKKEIEKGIEACDNFVFIISPRSINSPYCADEVEYASTLHKRFITILVKEIDSKNLHPALAKIQWINFSKGDFWLYFNELVRILDTDREHVRVHSKLSQRALEWIEKGKSRDLLLRGTALETARNWLKETESRKVEPAATELQKEYITRSRNQRRRNRGILIGSIVGIIAVLSTALGVSINLWRRAEKQAIRLEKQATRLKLRESMLQVELLQLSQPVEALVKAIEAVAISQENLGEVLPEVQRRLSDAVDKSREINKYNHDDQVTSVAFSPDGGYIVSGSGDKKVRLWDIKGNLLVTYHHDGSVTSIAFSRDGRYIVSGSWDKTVRLWDIQGNLLHTYHHDKRVTSVAFSPDGRYIVSGSEDKTVRLWDIQGNHVHTYNHDDSVWSVQFSWDGRYIVSGSGQSLIESKNNTSKLWDIQGNLLHTYHHQQGVTSVAFSPDGEYIVTGSWNGTVRLWDIKGNVLYTYNHDDRVSSVQFSWDGRYIVSGSLDSTVRLWDTKGNLLYTYNHDDSVWSVQFSPDGEYIVSGSGQSLIESKDNTVRLWDTKGNLFRTYRHDGIVNSVQFSRDGRYIVSGSLDSTVRLWDIKGNLLRTYNHDGSVNSVELSPDGGYIVSGSDDNTVRLWDTKGNLLHTYPHDDGVWSVQFSPDGQYLISETRDKKFRLWDTKGNLLHTYHHDERINSVQFSPDGRYIVSGSDDKTVRLWDIQGNLLHTYHHNDLVTTVQFSRDSQYIVSGSNDKTVRLWDIQGNLLHTYYHDDNVTKVQFSSDGQYIVSGSDDNTVRLWDTKGNLLYTYHHDDGVWSVQFSSDGQYIVSGSDDNTVRLWDTKGNLLYNYNHDELVTRVQLSSDGQYLVSGSVDNTVRLWRVGWESALEIGCNRLRYHPVFREPQTESQENAKKTCEQYIGIAIDT